jgi:hypothetical protein
VLWLKEQGIPDDFCDNFIDRNEFTKLTEAEVKDLVPPIGLAKKIIRMIPKVDATPPSIQSSLPVGGSQSTPLSPSPSCSFSSPGESEDTLSLSSASALSKEFKIPDSWPPSIMRCIQQEDEDEQKRLVLPSTRNEVVRILATNMFCHDPNPRKDFCTKVAKMLVKKYKFLRDVGDNVSGYCVTLMMMM